MANNTYNWTDNPTVSGVSICDTDILNDCLMHLKYDKKDGTGGYSLFDMKVTDHILTGDEAIGWELQGSAITMTYPDAVNKIKELYANGFDETYRGIECKKTIDGRYIADISQSTAIDKLFVDTGIVDFYIIDEINNLFYLPKSKYFSQLTVDTSLVNNYNEPGLPDHTHSYKTKSTTMPQAGSTTWVWVGEVDTQSGLASESNDIYGKSETVQPPASNKLLYYRVGDTVINSDQALIEATGIYNQTKQEIAQETEASIIRIQAEGSPLNITHISNCILEAPNGVASFKEDTLTVKQGLKVLIPNGRNNDNTLNNIVFTVIEDIVYTETSDEAGKFPFVINSDGTVSPTVEFFVQETQPSVSLTGRHWLKPSENKVYTNVSGTEWIEVQCTLIGIATRLADNNFSDFTSYQQLNLLKQSDKNEIINWGLPDYSRTISGVGNNYIAPSDGVYVFCSANNNASRSVYVNGIKFENVVNGYGAYGGQWVQISKGDNIYIDSTSLYLVNTYFIPLKGAN